VEERARGSGVCVLFSFFRDPLLFAIVFPLSSLLLLGFVFSGELARRLLIQWLLGEQPLVAVVSSLLLGRGLLRRRWSDLVFDLLTRT
jgi:hypothetical protein